jgi:hypothetical protein
MHGALRFGAMCVAAVAALTGVGLVVAALADVGTRAAIAWSLWIGGGLIAFLSASGGSTAENYSATRVVVGGRFTDSPPLPRAPLQYAVGIGVLVFVLG